MTAFAHVVGITGGSGSGKTTLAQALLAALSVDQALILPLDGYYRDLAHLDLPARRHQNFDAPEAIDWELFVAHLGSLRRGQGVERPVYDFASHTRRPASRPVEPRPLIIVEGLLLLVHAHVRALIDTSIFLDVGGQSAVARRVARDRSERGREPEDIRAQFIRDVWPMFERHVQPTRQWATLTLSGSAPVAAGVERVMKELKGDRG